MTVKTPVTARLRKPASNFARTSVAPKMKAMKHQVVSLAHDDHSPIVYDCSDAGTGKTAVRIWGFQKRRKKMGRGRALILAKRSLLQSAWGNDFKRFAPDLKFSIATAANREAAFAVEADAYVTNHDAVKWIVKQKKGFLDKFTELIIDEPTAFKHKDSQRSRAAARIAKHFWGPGYNVSGMTATPNSNGICDIWHQIYLLDGGKRLGPHFYAFRNSVCTPHQIGFNRNAIEWRDKDGAEEAVFAELSDIVIRHKLDDCTDIPSTHFYEVPYQLSPAQQKAYDTLELAQLLTFLPESAATKLAGAPPATAVTAVNAAAVANKLLQVASGAVYAHKSEYKVIDDGRYEMILDMVEDRMGRHPLVFFSWKHQKDMLVAGAIARKLKYAVIDGDSTDAARNAVVENYQRGAYDVVFAHPMSAAHGLTFTKGTSTIWSGPIYDRELYEQGCGRQRRIGQKHKTENVMVVAEGTIEEKVYEMLQEKGVRMKSLLDLFGTLAKERKLT